jgi:hypothetical protein
MEGARPMSTPTASKLKARCSFAGAFQAKLRQLDRDRRDRSPLFHIGPDGGTDVPLDQLDRFPSGSLRGTRPYFLVPVEETRQHQQAVHDRIRDWVEFAVKLPVTSLLRDVDLLRPAALVQWLRWAGAPRPKDETDTLALSRENGQHLRSLLSRRGRALVDTMPQALLGKLAEIDTLHRTAPDDRPEELDKLLDAHGEVRRAFEGLVNEMNELLLGPIVFVPGRFPAEAVSAEIAKAVSQLEPDGLEHMAINRQVIALAVNHSVQDGDVVAAVPESRGLVTDIYIVSHGWHRKFFDAVSAYDRLYSRFSILLSRRRLRSPRPYHALFLMLHWNSDPGQDDWVDTAGRRKLTSFLANVDTVFLRPTTEAESSPPVGANFTDTFEEVYQYLTYVSDPETQALKRTTPRGDAVVLARKLSAFTLRDAPHATPPEKVAAVWRCYFEADAQRPLLNQSVGHSSFYSLGRLLKVSAKFLFAVAGSILLGFLLKPDFWKDKVLPLLGIHRWNQAPRVLVAAFCIGALLMLTCILQQKFFTRRKRASGKPLLALGAWALMQVPLLILQLVLLLLGTLLASLFARFARLVRLEQWIGLYDERRGRRDADLERDPLPMTRLENDLRRHVRFLYNPRLLVAAISRLPTFLMRHAVSHDTRFPTFVTTIDNQLAFWEMQIRGTAAGEAAAAFIAGLVGDLRARDLLQPTVRVHTMGHSFGSLVIANTVRSLALTREYAASVPSVCSVCLIEGALASSWFEREQRLCQFIHGALACIYSGYDTANGFYYPLANAARTAAGYVGLTFAGNGGNPDHLPSKQNDDTALFASVLETPALAEAISKRGGRSQPPYILNLDASRIIFDGSVASGGGHDDIFKDDVVHLLWAVTRLG